MIVVLLGAPGSGKGTQAKLLSKDLALPHIASGDLFRDHLKRNTELGRLAQSYMNKGELVPDDVTIRMVLDRMSQPDSAGGAILDGFPRTLAQAEALDKALKGSGRKIVAVPYVFVPTEELLKRLASRLSCRTCGATYNTVMNPPKQPGVCDLDAGELYQREDDTVDVARKRLAVYFEETQPVVSYFREQGVLCEINGDQPIDAVYADLLVALRNHYAR